MKDDYERNESFARALVILILFIIATMGWMVFAMRIVRYVESQQQISEQHRAFIEELREMGEYE